VKLERAIPEPRERAFTLLEVMIAVALFFMCAFGILALVSQNLRAARMLKTSHVTASIMASQFALTNEFKEGMFEGTFEDIFPDLYPGYQWMCDVYPVSSNNLWQVDFAVLFGGKVESSMSVLYFKPGNAPISPSGFRPRAR
jgi:type II secretory pathway pseudopilin PulG